MTRPSTLSEITLSLAAANPKTNSYVYRAAIIANDNPLGPHHLWLKSRHPDLSKCSLKTHVVFLRVYIICLQRHEIFFRIQRAKKIVGIIN